MQVEVVDLMIGIDIDGVFMDMQAAGVTRDNARNIEEEEGVLATEMEWLDAIVNVEALENDEEPFATWLNSLLGFKIVQHHILPLYVVPM